MMKFVTAYYIHMWLLFSFLSLAETGTYISNCVFMCSKEIPHVFLFH